ncbi:hypothetical protein CSUI_002937 [Cystoisospora suis]|uniref:Uncharacterized protein n=1 Tax=Cystoisospora suis TaxID=483139 RepID=A0A2C6L4M3_9APIC|nr:hypothetical protein CSUI_002937 [Cystoisospora suis]
MSSVLQSFLHLFFSLESRITHYYSPGLPFFRREECPSVLTHINWWTEQLAFVPSVPCLLVLSPSSLSEFALAASFSLQHLIQARRSLPVSLSFIFTGERALLVSIKETVRAIYSFFSCLIKSFHFFSSTILPLFLNVQ